MVVDKGSDIVYINGEFKTNGEAAVDIEDRGYQFADGVYEVIVSWQGKLFKLEEHLSRLKRSAEELDIRYSEYERLPEVARELLNRNEITGALLYIQLTRGTAVRSHVYRDNMVPNIVMTVREYERYPEDYFNQGVKVITRPDERWSRCYIKTIALLPNVLAKKEAHEEGAFEAVLVRDGFVTEGTSSNVFIVKDEAIVTPPATNYILNGITRRVVINEAANLGYSVREEPVDLSELYTAGEVFLTGTTTEVMPVVNIDNKKIADGKPGIYTRNLLERYRNLL